MTGSGRATLSGRSGGEGVQAKTPTQTFLATLPLAQEKLPPAA
jgi:hypothetical protein